MADFCLSGNPLPIAAPRLKGGSDLRIKVCAHSTSIAKLCETVKQDFANHQAETVRVEEKPINLVLAEAMRFFMGPFWNNSSLARKSGVAEATIRNYLDPQGRTTGKSGKPGSAKLTEVQLIAVALGVTVSDLVTDATAEERALVHRRRASEFYFKNGRLPEWAPVSAEALDVAATTPVAPSRKRAAA